MSLLNRIKKSNPIPTKSKDSPKPPGPTLINDLYPDEGFDIEKGMFIECGDWEGGDIVHEIIDTYKSATAEKRKVYMCAIIVHRQGDPKPTRMRTMPMGYYWHFGTVISRKKALSKYETIR